MCLIVDPNAKPRIQKNGLVRVWKVYLQTPDGLTYAYVKRLDGPKLNRRYGKVYAAGKPRLVLQGDRQELGEGAIHCLTSRETAREELHFNRIGETLPIKPVLVSGWAEPKDVIAMGTYHEIGVRCFKPDKPELFK